jgi:hypothetical protein
MSESFHHPSQLKYSAYTARFPSPEFLFPRLEMRTAVPKFADNNRPVGRRPKTPDLSISFHLLYSFAMIIPCVSSIRRKSPLQNRAPQSGRQQPLHTNGRDPATGFRRSRDGISSAIVMPRAAIFRYHHSHLLFHQIKYGFPKVFSDILEIKIIK